MRPAIKLTLALSSFLSWGLLHATTLPTVPTPPSDPGFPSLSGCTVRHGAHQYYGAGAYNTPISPADDTDANATADTTNIQGALNSAVGGSGCVEIAPSPGGYSVLLLNPITIPAGVNLIVDAGVTLVATTNVTEYQVPGGPPCGGVGAYGRSS